MPAIFKAIIRLLRKLLIIDRPKLSERNLKPTDSWTSHPITFTASHHQVNTMEPYIRIRIAKDIIRSNQFNRPGEGLDWNEADRRYLDALSMATVGHDLETLPTAIPVVWQIGIELINTFGPNFRMLCNIISMAGTIYQASLTNGHNKDYLEALYSSSNPTSSSYKFWAKLKEVDPQDKIKTLIIQKLTREQ